MSKTDAPQHDIARTLYLLLPTQGVPKTLQEIRDQVRLLNEIRDPSDKRLARVIIGYFRDPRYSQNARFLKIDKLLSDEDLSARWTRARLGPAVSKPATSASGNPPNQELIAERLPAILATCVRSSGTSFYLWDLLKEHFGVTRDNNQYYHRWLHALSDTLKTDPRFVIVGVDEATDIPVEWMLAVDHERQVNDAVKRQISEVIAFLQSDRDLIHLTRDLTHRFFVPYVVDETYDIHAYYTAVSKALADIPSAIRISVQEKAHRAEAWCLKERVQQALLSQLDSVLKWMRAVEAPQPLEVILRHCFKPPPELASAEALATEVSRTLAADLRFLLDPDRGWRAIPPGLRENHAAYHVLWQNRLPLPEDGIIQMARDYFPTVYANFRLADDSRFRLCRGEKWRLAHWIDINDQAYEYLCSKKMPLLPATIRSKVCEQCGLDADIAIFTPWDDPRFVSRPHGRWYYRHTVTDAELNQMLALLNTENAGLPLNELVFQVVGLDACDTDASKRLAQDTRFACATDLWFSWERIFYRLTDDDVEQLLIALHKIGTGLRLVTLVEQALGRKAHLSDAEEKLRVDPRFWEVLPGVWMARDFPLLSEGRVPVFSRPVRSEQVSMVSEDEYTVIEDLTVRESQPSGEAVPIRRRQLTRTLSLLDVRHGNLIIDQGIDNLMSMDEMSVAHFIDELGNEFTGWIDRENGLLQGLGDWFRVRQLTFGDKIMIQATDQAGFLKIGPKGQRDERIYQEALQRQDIENLIDSARQTRKSYHDLMIEVMDYFNQLAREPVPLHREDIYNLVNYNRTASRNYIFSLLSLTDCPYEEFRYFVPHGRGCWSFDRAKRRAFEMKMKEILAKVESLEAENKSLRQSTVSAQGNEIKSHAKIARLVQQMQQQEARISELATRNQELAGANQRLTAVHDDQLGQIEKLRSQITALETQAASQATELGTLRSGQKSLQGELSDIQEERDRLRDQRNEQAHQLDQLAQDKSAREHEIAAFRAQTAQLTSLNATLQQSVDRLQDERNTFLREKAALLQQHEQTVASLRSQIRHWQQEYKELSENSVARQRELQDEMELVRNFAGELQNRIKALEQSRDLASQGVAQLRAQIDQVRSALQTPLGKGFTFLSRLLRGPDLSDL